MSEVLRPFLVDLEEVRKACGSRDAALISDILATQADFIADYEKQSRFNAQNVTSSRLTDLINGTVYPTGFAYLYGYCLELVCRHLGRLSPCSLFEDFHSRFLEKVRDLHGSVGPGTGRQRRKPNRSKPAKLTIVVDPAGVSATCENIAFHQLQTSLASITGQASIANTDHDWAISGSFSGADYLTVIRNALASIDIEVMSRETVYGSALVLRKKGGGANHSGYRLKGLDFEVRRYPVSISQYDEHPKISFLARDEFEPELEALKNRAFASREPIVNQARKQYSALVKRAARLNSDIVFFI